MKKQAKIIISGLTLGESPLWDYRENVFYCVDILEKIIYAIKDEQICSMDLPEYVSYIGLYKDNHLIVGLESGIYVVNFWKQSFKMLLLFNDKPNFRCNDGEIDSEGRLLIGRMNNGYNDGALPFSPDGVLYSIEKNKIVTLLEGVTISNGIVWNQSNTIMYYIDSFTQNIVQYDYNSSIGTIFNKKILYSLKEGSPDGMTIDTQGRLWVAIYGGYQILCIDSNTGTLLDKIILDHKNITSCVFGGRNLDTLYITTGKEEQKNGCVYTIHLDDSVGIKANVFRENL